MKTTDGGITWLQEERSSGLSIREVGLGIFPNPASSKRLRIRYVVPRDARVRIAVYNPLGQLEEVLVDNQLNAGTYEKAVRLRSGPGVYFVHLAVDGQTVVKKLITVE
jgi:hypothetical protein